MNMIETGSGNVFVDLGYADAKERTLKVQLAMEVNRLLKARGTTQAEAAAALGILQPHVSDLVCYRLDRFSVERLMGVLLVIRLPDAKRKRLKDLACARKQSMTKLFDEMATVLLAEFDAETRIRARAARGAGKVRRGLALLAKARGERRGG